eukprot:Hpha_TRINITY_DN4741_c0_g1::TRINITY_DN4741_c0_g1_i1::g.130525::m.130525
MEGAGGTQGQEWQSTEWGEASNYADDSMSSRRLALAFAWVVEQMEKPDGPLDLCTVKDVVKILNTFCYLSGSHYLFRSSTPDIPSASRPLPDELRVRGFAALARRLEGKVLGLLGPKALGDVLWLSATDNLVPLFNACAERVIKRPHMFDTEPYTLSRIIYCTGIQTTVSPVSEKLFELLLQRFARILPGIKSARSLGMACAGIVAAGHRDKELMTSVAHVATDPVAADALLAQPRFLVAVAGAVADSGVRSLRFAQMVAKALQMVARPAGPRLGLTLQHAASLAWCLVQLRHKDHLTFNALRSGLWERCSGVGKPTRDDTRGFKYAQYANLLYALAWAGHLRESLCKMLESRLLPVAEEGLGPSNMVRVTKHLWAISHTPLYPQPQTIRRFMDALRRELGDLAGNKGSCLRQRAVVGMSLQAWAAIPLRGGDPRLLQNLCKLAVATGWVEVCPSGVLHSVVLGLQKLRQLPASFAEAIRKSHGALSDTDPGPSHVAGSHTR